MWRASLMPSRSSDPPPPPVRKHQPEDAATTGARLVEQRRAVGLRELARQEEAEPRASPGAEERLENALRDLGFHSLAAIGNLEERAGVCGHASVSYLDGPRGVAQYGVLDGVVAQVPQDLPQLIGIRAHLEVGRAADRQPCARELHGVAELGVELLGPRRQGQA